MTKASFEFVNPDFEGVNEYQALNFQPDGRLTLNVCVYCSKVLPEMIEFGNSKNCKPRNYPD